MRMFWKVFTEKAGLCQIASWPSIHWSLFVTVLALACGSSGCSPSPNQPSAVGFTTDYGLGPDKWATAWLLTRHAQPGAPLYVRRQGQPAHPGTVFDSPSAPIRRVGNQAGFEVARAAFQLNDPTLLRMVEVVHEMEINFWNVSGPPETGVIEQAFRGLQYRYGRDAVTPECYVAFFERVYDVIEAQRTKGVPVNEAKLNLDCETLAIAAAKEPQIIAEVPLVDLVSAMAAGRKVVFVDVREPDEYAEAHIPGALNITLRDADEQLSTRLAGADYVVSYCVKDFRGFEMAKALADLGVRNSVIMHPYGIKGWVAQGLPVVGHKALTETRADAAIQQCLSDVSQCFANGRNSK